MKEGDTMSNCNKFREYIALYVYDELSGREKSELERHLADCRGCRRELDSTKQMLDLVSQSAVPEPSPEYWAGYTDRLRKRLEQEQQASLQERIQTLIKTALKPLRLIPAPAFAVIAVILVIGLIVLPRIQTPDSPKIARAPGPVITKTPSELSRPVEPAPGERQEMAAALQESVMSAELEDALVQEELALLAELSQDLYMLDNDQDVTREIELINDLEST
jgi:anti-sigma factor RsiW